MTLDAYLAAVNSGTPPTLACGDCEHTEPAAAGNHRKRCPKDPSHGFLIWYATAKLADYHRVQGGAS
jgi:hypothetical protein